MSKLNHNITRSGRWVRGLSGVVFLIIAVWLVFFEPGLDGQWLRWCLGFLLAGFGLFQVFEAMAGWCIMRALGFRTPM